MHIFLNNHSKLQTCHANFTSPIIFMLQPDLFAHHRCGESNNIKVVNAESLEKIKTHFSKELLKQDYLVRNFSVCCRLVAWISPWVIWTPSFRQESPWWHYHDTLEECYAFGLGHFQSRHLCPIIRHESYQWGRWQRTGRGPNIHTWYQVTPSPQLPLRPQGFWPTDTTVFKGLWQSAQTATGNENSYTYLIQRLSEYFVPLFLCEFGAVSGTGNVHRAFSDGVTRLMSIPITIIMLQHGNYRCIVVLRLGRCLHGYEANCYMNSVHVCPNIDHAIACKWCLAITSVKCSRTQNLEFREGKDRSTCLLNVVQYPSRKLHRNYNTDLHNYRTKSTQLFYYTT